MAAQVLVSTLPTNMVGQVSVLPVPVRFDWLRHLDANGVSTFFVELLETIWECQEAGQWDKLEPLLSAWEETAYLMQDPVLMARVWEDDESAINIPIEEQKRRLLTKPPCSTKLSYLS